MEITIDVDKVKIIIAFQYPTNLRELRGFLSYVGYYRRFIQGNAKAITPFTQLLKKEAEYILTAERKMEFEILKNELLKH